jgi:uncharacterized cupredoxin-like copper-binding protein
MSPRRLVVLSAAALALPAGAAAMSGCGNSASAGTPARTTGSHAQPANTAPAAHTVTARLSDYKISTSSVAAAAGRVIFAVTNAGKMPHEMVVIRTDKLAANLGHGSRVSEAGSVGEASDLAPGKTKRITLDLKPGHYALICNMPGHYAAGMHTDLSVR